VTATYPGGTNTYIPSTDATNNLVIDYSRNPNKFALADYAQYVPVDKNVGRYTKMTVEVAGRLTNTNLADHVWADGNDRNHNQGNTEAFEFLAYNTIRHQYGFRIGELAAEQASWPVVAQHSRIHAQLAMTARTLSAITAATTVGNWTASGHTSAVTSISGVTGKHDLSTTARRDIKRSFDYAANKIMLSTLSAVDLDDLMIVVSPDYARSIANSQEIVDYIKGSTDARREMISGANDKFGLPETLYGYPIKVEKTVRVSSRKGGTDSRDYVLDKTKPFMCARPGGLEGIEGSPSFSTLTCFLKEEMTVETKHDRDNRRELGSIVDDYDAVLTSAISGFLFQDAITA